jgi:hypothetical protein
VSEDTSPEGAKILQIMEKFRERLTQDDLRQIQSEALRYQIEPNVKAHMERHGKG